MQAETLTPTDAAIAWHLRLPEMGGHEWEDFVAWLELAPANRAAFDLVASADDALGEVRTENLPAAAAEEAAPALAMPDPMHTPHASRRHWLVGAAAACAALFGAWTLYPAAAGMEIERTAPGTTKELAFTGGTRIDLNGGTDLAVDGNNPRRARLDAGEALFTVEHKAEPFVVEAGGYVIRDLGTIFNVRLTERALEIAVREGSVLFDPAGANLTLRAGERLSLDRARGLAVKGKAANVGGWMRGELVFEDGTLADVVQAIHQRYGTRLEFSAGLSARPFTGNIVLTGHAPADIAHLAELIGAEYRREGDTWVLAEAGGAR